MCAAGQVLQAHELGIKGAFSLLFLVEAGYSSHIPICFKHGLLLFGGLPFLSPSHKLPVSSKNCFGLFRHFREIAIYF